VDQEAQTLFFTAFIIFRFILGQSFDGKIIEYEYTLQNYTFTTTLSKIRYVFGSSGQKLIRVRVKDNSGDWSESVSEYVVLN
jgi:hypothetical protein